MPSKIEWTDDTWNPVVGCSKISAGCKNCYAEKMACRLAHMGNRAYQDVTAIWDANPDNWFQKWNGKTAFVDSQLHKPLHWKKPRRIFVCSMGDLFHESVPFEWVDRVLSVVWQCHQHTFQILTKRSDRMEEYFSPDNERYSIRKIADRIGAGESGFFDPDMYWPLENLWVGVSVENQETADQRIPVLLQIPAAVRFVSVEPMLGPVNFKSWPSTHRWHNWLTGETGIGRTTDNLPGHSETGQKIDWVICGGESGPGARPAHPDRVRSIRDQCQAAGIPYFFKQWGEWLPFMQGWDHAWISPKSKPGKNRYLINGGITDKPVRMHSFFDTGHTVEVGKKPAGRMLDGVEWNQFPKTKGDDPKWKKE